MFLLVAATIWALAHVYVGRRVVRPLHLSPRRRRAVGWTFAVLWASGVVTFVVAFSLPSMPWLEPFQWVSFLYMGVFSILFALVAARDLALGVFALVRLAARRPRPDAPSLARRRFLTNATNAAAAGVSGVLSAWGVREAIRVPEVARVDVPIAGLPPGLDGYRIAQISDIHIGPTIKNGWVREVVDRTNALRADLVAVTGDLVDGSVPNIGADVAPIGDLRARDGVYFVTGNHEYYSGVLEWCEEVARLGLTVLVNEHRVLDRDGASIVVAGVTDFRAGNAIPGHASSPEKAFRDAPAADFRLLLAHQPRSIFEGARAGADLQLSGHTHDGQFFPWNLFVGLTQPYVAGLDRLGSTWIYVSRGTGYWGPPLRGGVPSEITLLTLRAA